MKKKCNKCGEEKDLDKFSLQAPKSRFNDINDPGYYRNICKKCRAKKAPPAQE